MLCALRVAVKSWGRAWKGQVSRELPRTNKQQRALPASVIRQDDCVSGGLGPVWSQPGSMSRRGLKQGCLEAVWKWHSPQVWLLGSTWYLKQYLIQVGKAHWTSGQRTCRWPGGCCPSVRCPVISLTPTSLNFFEPYLPLGVEAMDSVSSNLQHQEEVPTGLTNLTPTPTPSLGWGISSLVIIVDKIYYYLWKFLWLSSSKAWQYAHAVT